MKKIVLFLTLCFILFSLSTTSAAVDKSIWNALDKKQYTTVINEVGAIGFKTNQENYLLAMAYLGKNDPQNFVKYAKKVSEALGKMPKSMKLQEKIAFMFPPGKLKAAQKKAIWKKFKNAYTQHGSAVATYNNEQAKAIIKDARAIQNEAARERIKARAARKQAELKKEVATLKTKVGTPRRHGTTSAKGFIIVVLGLILLAAGLTFVWFVFFYMPAARARKKEMEHQRKLEEQRTAQKAFDYDPVDAEISSALANSSSSTAPLSSISNYPKSEKKRSKSVSGGSKGGRKFSDNRKRKVTRYNVGMNDDVFINGPFFYNGILFMDNSHFYGVYGHYYTNNMYMHGLHTHHHDHYDPNAHGEIMGDIDEMEAWGEEAIELETEAEHLEQDAQEAMQVADDLEVEAEEIEESMEILDTLYDDGFTDDGEEGFDDDEFTDDSSETEIAAADFAESSDSDEDEFSDDNS